MQSKVATPGKVPPKASVLPVAKIPLTFLIVLFIVMTWAGPVKRETGKAKLDGINLNMDMLENLTTKLDGLKAQVDLLKNLTIKLEELKVHHDLWKGVKESFIGFGKEMLARAESLTNHLDNLNNVTANISEMLISRLINLSNATANISEELTSVDSLFNKAAEINKMLTEDVKKMTADVEAITRHTDICPPTWTKYEDRCYLYVSKLVIWSQAEKYCLALGSHLASIHTQTISTHLRKLTQTNFIVWVGGYGTNSSWKWTDDSKFDVQKYEENGQNAKWGLYRPLDNVNRCVEIWLGFNTVNDEDCGTKQGFLCQK